MRFSTGYGTSVFCSCLYHFRASKASQKAGDVMVTVTTDSGHYIGYTWFKYKEEFAVTEVLKRLVKDRTLQSEYFAMLSQELKGGSRASDSKKTDALGQLNVPHLGKRNVKFRPVSEIFVFHVSSPNSSRFSQRHLKRTEKCSARRLFESLNLKSAEKY